MAHEFETGMFVRKPAWHELGIVFNHNPDTNEAFNCSGLDWTVRKELLRYNFNGEMKEGNVYGVIRESDGGFLGVCKDRYQLFQNKEAFDWCSPLVESGLYTWESAGSLKNGQTCWALLNSGDREIIPGDKLKNYLLFTWSHDGSKSVMIRPTSIRVVCSNTLGMAKREEGKQDKVRHTLTMKLKLEEVRRLYEYSEEQFQNQTQEFNKMLNTELTEDMKKEYVQEMADFIYSSDNRGKKSETIRDNFTNNLLRMIDKEASQQRELGIQNTVYGAFQATSEYLEHYATQRGEQEGYNVLFGSRGKQIDWARKLAMSFSDGKTPFRRELVRA